MSTQRTEKIIAKRILDIINSNLPDDSKWIILRDLAEKLLKD
jgi:hypothetical protein